MYSFPDLEPACCPMSSSNCCFLTCIQISQEVDKLIWYSSLSLRIFHSLLWSTQKLQRSQWSRNRCFFFFNSFAFSMIQQILAIWSLVLLPFLNPTSTSGSSQFTYCWSLAWRILSVTLLACEMSAYIHINICTKIFWCNVFQRLQTLFSSC